MSSPWISVELDTALAGLLGLLVGSFLNVVIYRLPKMLESQWARECAALQAGANGPEPTGEETFNLLLPRSRCGNCGHTIAWHENIPVLSYLVLRGRCSQCQHAFGLRYPLVELVTGVLWAACAWRWGPSWTALAWACFGSALLALAAIDWDTTLLPDDITLPLIWAGLATSALGWSPVALVDSVWGAMAGYLSLWLVYWAFKLTTGKEGMGYGDFKLLAGLGAWFGWQGLIPIILMSSVIGALVGIGLKLSAGLREGGYIPFGPFLALAGMTAMFISPAGMLGLVGL